MPHACRLRQIPGIPAVRHPDRSFHLQRRSLPQAREFAAWLPAPKQHSTGGKAKLYGISKRGNRYLRKILIHGLALSCCDPSEIASRWAHGRRRLRCERH